MYKQQTNIDKSKIISTLVKIFVCRYFLNNQIGKNQKKKKIPKPYLLGLPKKHKGKEKRKERLERGNG